MQDDIKKILNLLNSENLDLNVHKTEIETFLKKVSKKRLVDEFLVSKYKNDYETTVEFLNRSIQDIEEKHEELLRVNMELERFAYVVSHDLKAPVRTIVMFMDILDQQIKPYENQTIEESTDFIKKASKQLHELIQDTLEHSRLNNKEMKKEAVDLNLTVEVISELVLRQERNYEIKIESDTLPVVEANRAMMHKLFHNIIHNGIKYNQSDIRTIHIKYTENNSHHIFEIADNGIGMSTEGIQKVFKMYARLHTQHEYEGTGIGLSICKKIVENHKGNISVVSELENGSTFTFSIKKTPISQSVNSISSSSSIS